jgi:hypothetical protein
LETLGELLDCWWCRMDLGVQRIDEAGQRLYQHAIL